MRVHAKIRAMASESRLVGRWRQLLTSYSEVACRLDRDLGEAHGLTMNEFEVLDRLAEQCRKSAEGGSGCRMQDLAASAHLSQSALSRTVARLERDGLVSRVLCEQDRRGVFVKLTEAGRRRHEEASATRMAVLAELLT